jgi:RNA polymerase sigma factor (sigma-70 family)
MDDWELLKSYASENSQDAFTEIVRRHLNLVYSAALRQVGEPELARDVAQLVFANLARRARSLKPKGTLAGWLFHDAHFTSLDILRRERRRVAREQHAVAMQDAETLPDWREIKPRLDTVLSQLGQTDRDAILLRFFEQRSLKDVGLALGMDEDAARKRVSRALEKLRALLAKQGVTTTSGALSGAMMSHAVHVAPAGLAAGILASSLAAGSAATVAGASTFMEFLTMTTKLKVTAAAAVVLAAVGTPVALQHTENKSLRAENEVLRGQTSYMATLEAENQRLSNRVVEIGNNNVTGEQQSELNRLRAEVARLRASANEADQLRSEINRLRAGGGAAARQIDPTTEELVAYLGQAVLPPADINPAHTQEGLLNAVQQAAQLAAVPVKKAEIDTTEFPFLVGVVCNSDEDFRKLTSQFKSMPSYDYGGGTSSHGAGAFNLIPYPSYPPEDGDRIRRRTMVRTQKLFDGLTAGRQIAR